MRETEQYSITEPELQLYNEGKDENYSLPSFASPSLRKPYKTSSTDDTNSMCTSTDQSSFTSTASEPLVKVVDRCYQPFRESESFEVEYSLADYESKLYLEDMKKRLDEPLVEELEEDSINDEFDEDYDDDENESLLSLNTLENDLDEFVTENCKIAVPQAGCLGFMFSVCREQEEDFNEFYANDDAHLMRRSYTAFSSIYDGDDDVSCIPSEPVGEKFVTNEISFTKDTTTHNTHVVTGINLTEAGPLLLDQSATDGDNQNKPKEHVVQETESVSSDWGHSYPSNRRQDAASHATTSIYLGAPSLSEDEVENRVFSPTNLEPDGIKMRSHKDRKIEIQGNGVTSSEELEVLHLEEPAADVLEA